MRPRTSPGRSLACVETRSSCSANPALCARSIPLKDGRRRVASVKHCQPCVARFPSWTARATCSAGTRSDEAFMEIALTELQQEIDTSVRKVCAQFPDQYWHDC